MLLLLLLLISCSVPVRFTRSYQFVLLYDVNIVCFHQRSRVYIYISIIICNVYLYVML